MSQSRSLINMAMALVAASFAMTTFTGCRGGKNQTNIELIQDMMESPALKAQEYDESAPNHSSMRVPPEGTQPQGFTPYKYGTDAVAAAANQNPMAGKYTEEILETGLKYYTINCTICHGANGEGGDKLSVAETMALKPPSLVSDKIKGWTDGQLYHVITMGQGMMGPYGAQIPQQYRWQVVNYIRTLQGKGN
jgi:mono/diheme cytochrome c family protein